MDRLDNILSYIESLDFQTYDGTKLANVYPFIELRIVALTQINELQRLENENEKLRHLLNEVVENISYHGYLHVHRKITGFLRRDEDQ